MPQPPRKPTTKPLTPGSQYRSKPPDAEHAGELFRVRDKDWERVWGENMTYADAHKLKETVCGQNKSRTARVEPMSVEPPDWYQAEVASGNTADPELAALRAPAVSAAKKAAAEANVRHAVAAAKDRSAPAGAKRVSVLANKPAELPKVPVVSTVAPEDDEEDFVVNADEVNGLGASLAEGQRDQPTAEDLARAKAKRDADAREAAASRPKVPPKTPALVARAKELYAEECARRGGGVAFDRLHVKTQEAWLIEAAKPPVEPPVPESDIQPPATDDASPPDGAAPGVPPVETLGDAPAVDKMSEAT